MMNITGKVSRILLTPFVFLPFSAFAESGLYIGGSVGSDSIDTNNAPFRFTVGLLLDDNFAVEGGYHSFGTLEDRVVVGGEPVDLKLKPDGYTLGFTGSIPMNDNFSLFGRAGVFFWDGDALVNSVLFGRVNEFFWDEDAYLWDDELYLYEPEPGDTNSYFGGGATVSVNDRLDLVGDWTRYKLETTKSDVFSIGFTYRF